MADSPHQIAVLAFNHTVGFDLGMPAQVFGAARRPDGRRQYRVAMCTPDSQPIQTSAGYRAHPDSGPELLETADTVIIPGLTRHSPFVAGPGAEDLSLVRDALARTKKGARLVSICTGAFALAAAGVLDGHPATTHWAYTTRFRERYPAIELHPDVLFVDAGPVLTSAGVAAGIDLCLHIVRRDHGSEVANRAARRCVVPAWRDGGQAQFIERPLPAIDQASTGTARAWALAHLHEQLELVSWARQATMSVRTFTRRFREENGVSPAQWLAAQRVEHARRLLETTELPVDLVAEQSGFGTATSLRQHLRAQVGVSPLAYRRAFR